MPSGYVVARAILLKGGLKARKYLEGAFNENRSRVVKIIERGAGRVANS
jgi:hypothetical protein